VHFAKWIPHQVRDDIGVFGVLLCLLLALSIDSRPALAQSDADSEARAHAIHDRILTIDTHVDIPPDFGSPAYDAMGQDGFGQQLHIPSMVAGGLDAAFLIVYVRQGELNPTGYAQALADAFTKFADIHRVTEVLHPDKVGLALTAADVRRIHAEGKRVVLIGMENGYPMGRDLRLLDIFYDYGARYFGLVHFGNNDLGDSSLPHQPGVPDLPAHGGLTPLGRQTVDRLNELGIMVDVSHSSKDTALDMLAVSHAPVIASHSGVKGVSDHPRNLSDEELVAIKRSGGVAQIVAYDSYLRPVPPEKTEAIKSLGAELGLKDPEDFAKMSPETRATYAARMAAIDAKWPKASVKDLVDHIDYAVKKIGIDSVGIASDFNGGGGIAGWSNAGETFNVTLELVRRGYSEAEIAKLWGGNLLRVMERVEAYAAHHRAEGH
jgi:membrane dipeptidase